MHVCVRPVVVRAARLLVGWPLILLTRAAGPVSLRHGCRSPAFRHPSHQGAMQGRAGFHLHFATNTGECEIAGRDCVQTEQTKNVAGDYAQTVCTLAVNLLSMLSRSLQVAVIVQCATCCFTSLCCLSLCRPAGRLVCSVFVQGAICCFTLCAVLSLFCPAGHFVCSVLTLSKLVSRPRRRPATSRGLRRTKRTARLALPRQALFLQVLCMHEQTLTASLLLWQALRPA